MTGIKGHVKKTGMILAAAILTGYLLLVLVYLIPTGWMQKQVSNTAKMMEVSETQTKDPYSGRIFDTVVLYGQGFPPLPAMSLSSETATAPMTFLIWTCSIFHWLPRNMIL